MKDKEKKRLAGKELLSALERICDGLVFISETDAPMVPFLAPGKGYRSVAGFIRNTMLTRAEEPVNCSAPDEMLDRLSEQKNWHGPAERERADRFRSLRNLLLQDLDHVTLIRAGRVRILIFVAGFDDLGNIAGFRTEAVET